MQRIGLGLLGGEQLLQAGVAAQAGGLGLLLIDLARERLALPIEPGALGVELRALGLEPGHLRGASTHLRQRVGMRVGARGRGQRRHRPDEGGGDDREPERTERTSRARV